MLWNPRSWSWPVWHQGHQGQFLLTMRLCAALEVWDSYLEGLGTSFTTRCCWHQRGNTEEARKRFYGSVVTSHTPPNSRLLQSPAHSQLGALLRCSDMDCFSLTCFLVSSGDKHAPGHSEHLQGKTSRIPMTPASSPGTSA